MATSKFPFSAESLKGLGLTAERVTSAGENTARLLGFPDGVKVTKAAEDGAGGVVLSLSGAKLSDGSEGGTEITGSYWVLPDGRRVFEGFRAVDDPIDQPPAAAPALAPEPKGS